MMICIPQRYHVWFVSILIFVADLVKKQLTKWSVVSKNKINNSNTSAKANIEQTLHRNDLSNYQHWIPLRTTKLTSHLVILYKYTHIHTDWHHLRQKLVQTRMRANAQRDGRPAEHPVALSVQCHKVWLMPTTRYHAVTLPRRETHWILQGCLKLPDRSQPLVGRSSPYCGDVEDILLLNNFFRTLQCCRRCFWALFHENCPSLFRRPAIVIWMPRHLIPRECTATSPSSPSATRPLLHSSKFTDRAAGIAGTLPALY